MPNIETVLNKLDKRYIQVLEQAEKREIPVRLSVFRINPAKAFYEHLGFKVIGSDEYSFFMEWQTS